MVEGLKFPVRGECVSTAVVPACCRNGFWSREEGLAGSDERSINEVAINRKNIRFEAERDGTPPIIDRFSKIDCSTTELVATPTAVVLETCRRGLSPHPLGCRAIELSKLVCLKEG